MIKLVGACALIAASGYFLASGEMSKASAQGGSCMANFNSEISSLTQNKPMNPNWGMRDTFQWSYFIGEQGINILMKYQSCLSPEDFASNYSALDGMRDKGRQGCEQTSSGSGTCVPRYPGE